METEDLHGRLEALGHKIHAAEERLREEKPPHRDAAHRTAQELKERYAHLQARVNSEIADVEAQGHHVNDLERAVRQWLDSISRK